MKKFITCCFFAVSLLFNTQDLLAQNTSEINAEANTKTEHLIKLLKLDKEATEAVFKAYQDYGKAYAKFSNNASANQESLKKLETVLDKKLEAILSENQYRNYLELVRGL